MWQSLLHKMPKSFTTFVDVSLDTDFEYLCVFFVKIARLRAIFTSFHPFMRGSFDPHHKNGLKGD